MGRPRETWGDVGGHGETRDIGRHEFTWGASGRYEEAYRET